MGRPTEKEKMSDKADYWRKRINEMSDPELEHWIEGVAHLKLRHTQCEGRGQCGLADGAK